MTTRRKTIAGGKQRDVFDWVGVAVDLTQALFYAAAVIAALYWYVVRGGGLPAVVVGLAVAVGVLLVCVLYVLFANITRQHRSR
jgi:Flp pilus assembly protein TadB